MECGGPCEGSVQCKTPVLLCYVTTILHNLPASNTSNNTGLPLDDLALHYYLPPRVSTPPPLVSSHHSPLPR